MERRSIGRDTTLCMSLSGRPGTFGSRFHNHLYDALDLDFVYKAFTTTDLPAAIGGIRALGVRGCAISMPFKEAVIPLIDGLGPTARAIESVNTIVNDGGVLTGHNTDYGAIGPLLRKHDVNPAVVFVVRGSGGMAKAVAHAMHDAGYRNGTIWARNSDAGRALAVRCGFKFIAELGALRPELLVNVTPIGMVGGAEAQSLAFDESAIARARYVFDVVAVPIETPLIRAARSVEKVVITGGEVVVLQALEQFTLYTGLTPTPGQVAAAAQFALG
jgi:shikimate dehydrogenase